MATEEYVLRHAQSLGNIAKILVSNPADGVGGYGITELGRTQVRESLTPAVAEGFGKEKPKVYICSPFDRAILTAHEARLLADGLIVIDYRLSERRFGEFDKTADANLQNIIWPADAQDENNSIGGVESPAAVAERLRAVRRDAQEAFPGYTIVYVTHGDICQIAEADAQGLPPGKHRSVEHMKNAELRRLPQ